MLEKITRSSHLNLLSGLILLITAGYETWEAIEDFNLGAHHGVLIFSIIQILKSLPEFLEGAKDMAEAKSAA